MAGIPDEDKDLQELLDSALDDFRGVVDQAPGRRPDDQQTSSEAAQAADRSQAPDTSAGQRDEEAGSASRQSEQADVQEAGPSPALGLGLPSLQPKKKGKKGGTKAQSSTSRAASSQGSGTGAGPSTPGLDEDLTKTLEQLAEQTRQTLEGMDPGTENMDDEVVEKLMRQFEQLGGNNDMQGVMDTMMKQLLSKDVLYQPLVEIGERYPAWLEAHRSRLSEADYQRFSRQHHFIKELCHAYEATPDDFDRIVNLMQQMQECGHPPDDIVKELAPGMEFGDDGLPMLPDMLSGAGGPPGQGNCCIM